MNIEDRPLTQEQKDEMALKTFLLCVNRLGGNPTYEQGFRDALAWWRGVLDEREIRLVRAKYEDETT